MPSTKVAKKAEYLTGVPRQISNAEMETVTDILQEFSQMTIWRNQFAIQWEEVSQLIHPISRNTFFYGNYTWPGQKKTHQQIDATGMMALHRFAAICDSMLTPRNMEWHQLRADDDYVMKDRQTSLWFEEVNRRLFNYRNDPTSNFTGQNQNNFQSLGAFGNAGMFIDKFDGRLHGGKRGLRYKSIPLGELFMRENHQGLVDGFVRWFRLTAYQAVQKWGIEALPASLHAPLKQNSQWGYNFLHCVRPRTDYDVDRLDVKSLPFASYYVSVEGRCMMGDEGGYRSLPLCPSRYDQGPNEVYGRGPAMMVLPALKTLNAEKADFLEQGHRAVKPVFLTGDDGIIGFTMRPGALNKGALTEDGKKMIDILPSGNIQISETMMEMEKTLIDDAFLVSLFKLILDEKILTATQVTEIVNQKGILIAPTLGRQQSEYLGPMIDRELDLLAEQRLLPPMPPRLREANGSYKVVYTSPLAKAQRAGEVSGFTRTLDIAHSVAQNTGDASVYDGFDFEAALPAIADINGSPVSWMSDKNKMAQKAQARAKAAQIQQQIQAMPSQAAMMKAQAVQAKAGMQPQGGQQQGQQPQPQ
jgi:hypothetical protein